jgi:hypothetical protein
VAMVSEEAAAWLKVQFDLIGGSTFRIQEILLFCSLEERSPMINGWQLNGHLAIPASLRMSGPNSTPRGS